MLQFDTPSTKKPGSARKSKTPAPLPKAPPTGPKAQQSNVSRQPAAPNSTADPNGRRSLPWNSGGTPGRPSNAPGGRVSSASDTRRGSNSEYAQFSESYRALNRSQEGAGSEQRRINVLGWNLDPL